jgi:hypothetical protein
MRWHGGSQHFSLTLQPHLLSYLWRLPGAQAGWSGQQPNGGIDPEPAQQEGYVLAGFDLDECRMNRAG